MKKTILFTLFIAFFTQTKAQFFESIAHPMPSSIGEGSVAFVIGDSVAYIGLGSKSSPTSYSNQFVRYHFKTGNYSSIPNFPGEARAYAISFVANGKGYVGFGEKADPNTGKVTQVYNDLYAYNPISNTWSKDLGSKTAILSVGQASAFTVKEGSQTIAYIVGGRNELGTAQNIASFRASDETWISPINNTTGLKREGASVFVYKNKAYLLGGNENGKQLFDLLTFDPSSALKWTTTIANNAFLGTSKGAATVFKDTAYIFNGTKSKCTKYVLPTGKITEFSLEKNTRKGIVAFSGTKSVFMGLGRYASGNIESTLDEYYWDYSFFVTNTKESEPAPPVRVQLNQRLLSVITENNTYNSFQIFDTNGKLFFTQKINLETTELDVSNLLSGVYVVVLNKEKYRKSIKIVIQ
jgi:N-acetylneuraminic acid mutarotase